MGTVGKPGALMSGGHGYVPCSSLPHCTNSCGHMKYRELTKLLQTETSLEVYAEESASVDEDLGKQVGEFVEGYRSPDSELDPEDTLYGQSRA